MANKFAVVGISGLVICVACLTTAAAIGGRELVHSNFGGIGEGERCAFGLADKQGSRSMAWNGGDSVAIAIPAKVQYRRGTGDQVVISGDSAILPHIRISDSTIKLDCRWQDRGPGIEITLPGRPFRGFKLAGAGSLTLEDIDQPTLNLSIAGAGEIKANGKTDDLDLNMAGAGNAELGALSANRVQVRMAGANNAEVSPKDDLNVSIAGLGDVKLLTEPRKIESDIAGAGHITHMGHLDKDI
jgi:hypothetical protein